MEDEDYKGMMICLYLYGRNILLTNDIDNNDNGNGNITDNDNDNDNDI